MEKEKIKGSLKLKLLKELLDNRIVLNMIIIGLDYERLTVMADMVNENGSSYLVVDYTDGFREIAKSAKGKKVLFQFMGKDRINYSFRTGLKKYTKSDIWVKIPPHIERIQRRKHFRIATPSGSKLLFNHDDYKCETAVVNLSLGGILVVYSGGRGNKASFFQDEYIRNASFVCTNKSLKIRINFKKSIIRRVEKYGDTIKQHIAFQFVDINPKDADLLNTWLLRCQREQLKKRSFLEKE